MTTDASHNQVLIVVNDKVLMNMAKNLRRRLIYN